MSRNIDTVEIKEPPIQELNKKRSCLRRSCFTGCLLIVGIVLVFWLFVRFTATPRVKELKDIPDIVPKDIPLYDKDAISKISFVSAKEKSKAVEIASILPRIIIAPFYLSAEEYLPQEIRDAFTGVEEKEGWDKFIALVKQPLFEESDLVKVEWTELDAEPDFIARFFETELQKADYTVTAPKLFVGNTHDLTFSKNNVRGVLTLTDYSDARGTDEALLVITITPET